MSSQIDPDYDYASEYAGHDQGIAVVGAGAIVEAAHLPAYGDAGFDVVGLYDKDHERATEVAEGAPQDLTVYDDLPDLLSDDEVDVVDIAVPPMYQRDIVEAVVKSGRHVLCQKPLSDDLAKAEEIIEMVEDADVDAAVNQQMRWEKSMRAVKQLLEAGELGTPLRGKIEVNIDTDWSAWGWIVDAPRMEVMYHSIHYLDTMRYLFGEPRRVRSTMARAPGQLPEGETRTLHLLEYGDDLRAMVDANHNNWADGYAEFRFEGTEGTVRGTIGLFDNYPESGPDVFEYRSDPDAEWESHHIERAWFPDAFIGTMGSLLESIESGERAPTHPTDNIETLRLANATYQSASEKVAVEPSTVDEDHYYEEPT
jgi:predicted dehydrogenase